MGRREFTIVPIMVGAINKESESHYGQILSHYLKDEETAFVVSSDFCHWGKRFDYTPYDESHGAIHMSIEAMDRKGMQTIEAGDPVGFSNYLKQTKNTICGRHPISVMLWALHHVKDEVPSMIKSIHYEQSSQCVTMRDSSVSYGVLAAHININSLRN
jgi:MEMO1 family protein